MFFLSLGFIDFLAGINESVSELVVDSAMMEWWSLPFSNKVNACIVA